MAARGERPTRQQRHRQRGALIETIAGSGALWAWGFLCYLSPVLITNPASHASVGLEFGFFASQAAVVATAVLLIVFSRRRPVALGPAVLLGAAVVMAGVSLALPWLLQAQQIGAVVALGVATGVAGTLCGSAWGARYSLDFRHAPSIIILSFLFAYVVYLVVSHFASGTVGAIIVAALPLVSMGLRTEDAARRHHLSWEVFPSPTTGPDLMPGEIIAGSWEARLLPWRPMSAIILAAFIGNFISSTIMGTSYEAADSLFAGGVSVCFFVAIMALVPFTAERRTLAVLDLYRTTVAFVVAGLLIILALREAGLAMGGALVQGCAMFLQVLVYVLVTQSTQREGLAPLLSFSVGQGLISAVVLAGNVLGKQFYRLGSGNITWLEIACAVGVLLLFIVVVSAKEKSAADHGGDERLVAEELVYDGNAPGTDHAGKVAAARRGGTEPTDARSAGIEADGGGEPAPDDGAGRTESFVARFGLTKREAEVLEYLVRGRSLPYIADALFVTTGTVKTHVKHIYRKCAVGTRQELLDLFEREG